MNPADIKTLLKTLTEYGLGNLYALHPTQHHVYFGNIKYEKGQLSVIDSGLLTNLNNDLFDPVWKEGLVGMVCKADNKTWDSLSFYGLDKCRINPSFGNTRGNALLAAQNQYGDSIIDFEGSVYRGFQLLLDNSFLPTVLINPVKSTNDDWGLAVADLRTVPLELDLLIKLNDTVVKSIAPYKTLSVGDIDLSESDFHKYFNGYIE